MKIGQTVDLTVTDVSRGGAGVARLDTGRTVFIPFTMTGDRVRVRVSEIKKKFANGELIDIIEPAPDRQQAKCTVFGQCGGCQWQHIPYADQWQIKLTGVQQSLKSAKIRIHQAIDEFPAQQIWNYRNRVQLHGEQDKLGYYAPRSHNIIDINQCEIASPQINAMLSSIRNEGRLSGKPYKVELEVLPGGEVRSIWNQPHGAAGFRQINDEQNNNLKKWIRQSLVAQQPVYDLYGGSGNLTWDLAAQGRKVNCIDLSVPEHRPENCPSGMEFYQSDILPWLKQYITDIKFKRIAAPDSPHSAVIDPPRGGLGDAFDDIIERLEFLRVNEIVAVGCKTDSWVRDLNHFTKRGWKIHGIAAFDFFPHTTHVETTALLRKN